jgi:hypothetical protein
MASTITGEHWRKNDDLAHTLQRDWAALGPKLRSRENAYSRLRYPQMVLPWVVGRILDMAPPGAGVDSWRY